MKYAPDQDNPVSDIRIRVFHLKRETSDGTLLHTDDPLRDELLLEGGMLFSPLHFFLDRVVMLGGCCVGARVRLPRMEIGKINGHEAKAGVDHGDEVA